MQTQNWLKNKIRKETIIAEDNLYENKRFSLRSEYPNYGTEQVQYISLRVLFMHFRYYYNKKAKKEEKCRAETKINL